MSISERELESVLDLSKEKRYSYFIKRICDHECLWVMSSEDGALAINVDQHDKESLYVFPFEEFVDYFQEEEEGFEDYHPKKIKLSKFIQKWAPSLQLDQVASAYVFPVPEGYGLNVDFKKMIHDIEMETEELSGKNDYHEKEKVKKLKD